MVQLIKSFFVKASDFLKNIKSKSEYYLLSAGIFFFSNTTFAAGEDILAEPTRNLFSTFAGTGCNLLLLSEVCAAAYCLTTQRKMAALVVLPTIIVLTSYAKLKFGS